MKYVAPIAHLRISAQKWGTEESITEHSSSMELHLSTEGMGKQLNVFLLIITVSLTVILMKCSAPLYSALFASSYHITLSGCHFGAQFLLD